MRIFVAGATGAVGRRLVPRLTASGHEVIAMTRSPEKVAYLRELGAEPVVADALRGDDVMKSMMRAEPEVVVHELTGLTGVKSLRNFDKEFALTNRLRTDGTDLLLEAARAAGARRFVAQSFGNWNYEPTGRGPKTEEAAFDPDPPSNQRKSLAAIRHLEKAVLDAGDLDGVVLRYGNFYGAGTGFASDSDIVRLLRRRRFPIIGDGAGVWSFVHIDDAAAATGLAIELGRPGAYNIADDEPAPVAEWLPELARVLGAEAPRRVPTWLGRLAGGEVGVSMMTRIRGASNAKAKSVLGWRLLYRTWRDGFTLGLSDRPVRLPAARAAR